MACLNLSTGIATIQGLLLVLSNSKATTVQELVYVMEATAQFKRVEFSTIAVKSASDTFTLHHPDVG